MTAASVSPPSVAAQPLHLGGIYFSSSELKLADDFDPLIPGQVISGVNTIKAIEVRLGEYQQPDRQINGMEFRIVLEFVYWKDPQRKLENVGLVTRANAEELKLAIAASVNAVIQVRLFQDPGAAQPSVETAALIGQVSALRMAWPYWREYVQSSVLRMNLPAVTIPVMPALVLASQQAVAEVGPAVDRDALPPKIK